MHPQPEVLSFTNINKVQSNSSWQLGVQGNDLDLSVWPEEHVHPKRMDLTLGMATAHLDFTKGLLLGDMCLHLAVFGSTLDIKVASNVAVLWAGDSTPSMNLFTSFKDHRQILTSLEKILDIQLSGIVVGSTINIYGPDHVFSKNVKLTSDDPSMPTYRLRVPRDHVAVITNEPNSFATSVPPTFSPPLSSNASFIFSVPPGPPVLPAPSMTRSQSKPVSLIQSNLDENGRKYFKFGFFTGDSSATPDSTSASSSSSTHQNNPATNEGQLPPTYTESEGVKSSSVHLADHKTIVTSGEPLPEVWKWNANMSNVVLDLTKAPWTPLTDFSLELDVSMSSFSVLVPMGVDVVMQAAAIASDIKTPVPPTYSNGRMIVLGKVTMSSLNIDRQK